MGNSTKLARISDLNPLLPFITYEDNKIIVFEFPCGVMSNFYKSCFYALKFFTDIEVQTDVTLKYALKVTCTKRGFVPLLSNEAKIQAKIDECEKQLLEIQKQKLLN